MFGHGLDGEALVWDLWMHVLYDTLPVTGELRFYSYLSSHYFLVCMLRLLLCVSCENRKHISIEEYINYIHGLLLNTSLLKLADTSMIVVRAGRW